jgi:hypothetical protein
MDPRSLLRTSGYHIATVCRRALRVATLTALATSCSVTSPSGRSAEMREYQRNRERWDGQALHDYEFDFSRGCFCATDATEPVHIVVRSDAIVAVVRLRDGAPASGGAQWPRVDELFADVLARLQQSAARVSAAYDPEYGYPRTIVVDVLANAVDDEYSLTAANLRPLP